MSKLLSRGLVLGLAALGLCFAVQAQAAVIVADSFLSGVNPGAGEYTTSDLAPQNPTVSTFNAAWANGLVTMTTGTFDAVPAGLTWTGFNASGGAVQYQYTSSLANVQAAVRPFTNAVMAPNVIYYMAGLMSFDSSFSTATTSVALTGLLNAEEGDPAVLYPLGAQWGFQGNGTGVDAVFRARSTSTGNPTATNVVAANILPGTHLFVVKVESDYQQVTGGTGSADRVSVWLDPVVGGPEYGMSAATFVKDYANWLDPSTDLTRTVKTAVLRATDVGAGAAVGFDEVRLGDRWRDIMPQANPDVVYLRQGYDNDVHLGCGIRQSTTSQYADELLVGSGSGTNDYRSVLAIGTGAVPDGAIVTDVELTFTVKRVSYVDGTGPIELRLTDPSVDMVENEVTWALIRTGTNWTTGGGDPQSTVLGSVNQPNAALDVVTFHATPALLAAVQDACNGDELLELVMMAPQAESATTTNFVGFYSDDATNMSYRPLLKITYVPEPGILALLFGVAALFAARRTRV
jgi:hypothetical protein